MESPSKRVILIVWASFGLWWQVALCDSDISMTVTPGSQVAVGGSITVSCKTMGQLSSSVVKWTMKQASFIHNIGQDKINTNLDTLLPRHILSTGPQERDYIIHNLTITGAQPEDTAGYGCGAYGHSDTHWVNIAVCETPGSSVCKCLEKEGWVSPECYTEPPEVDALEKKYKTTITALIVFLVIAVLFGIGLAIMVGRDCMLRKIEERKREAQKREAQKRSASGGIRTSYTDTERLAEGLETNSQASYENQPTARRDQPPGYTSASQHTNGAYAPDDEPEYRGVSNGPRYPNKEPRHASHEPAQIGFEPTGMEVEAEMHRPLPKVRGRRGMSSSSGSEPGTPRTPDGLGPVAPPRRQGEKPNGGGGYPTSNGDVGVRSPGYDSQPSYNPEWQRPDGRQTYDRSPGVWSTKSADPHYGPQDRGAAQRGPLYPNIDPRNAYSEGPKADYGAPTRSHYTEPRRLDFVNDKNVYENAGRGAYIDKTDTVV